MKSTTSIAIWLASTTLLFAGEPTSTSAHPGPTDMSDGCHVCKENCEKYDLDKGEHHCHERAGMGTEKSKDVEQIKKRVASLGDISLSISLENSKFCGDGLEDEIRKRESALEYCYESKMETPKNGKVIVESLIGLDGTPMKSTVSSADISNPDLQKCVWRVLQRIEFAKPKGGLCKLRTTLEYKSSKAK